MTLLFLSVLLFAWADRFSGGGFGWDRLAHANGGPLRGRGIGYSMILIALVLGIVTGDWKNALWVLPFGIWRSPAWKIGGKGGIAPVTQEDRVMLFVRHMLAAAVLPFAYWLDGNWYVGLATVPAFALGATLLGVHLRRETDRGRDANNLVEIVRGGLFGLMMWSVMPH